MNKMDFATWEQMKIFYRCGRTTRLLVGRRQLSDAIAEGEVFRGSDENEQLFARAISADLDLLMLAKESAATVALEPYLDLPSGKKGSPKNHRLVPNWNAIHQLSDRTLDSYVVGVLLMQLANCLYRHYNFIDGEKLARAAELAFVNADLHWGATSSLRQSRLELTIASCENATWLARLVYHNPGGSRHQPPNRRQEAESLLHNAIRRLTFEFGNSEAEKRTPGTEESLRPRGRRDLVLSMALNMLALLDESAGRLDISRRRIYRALFLLSQKYIEDDIRMAHSLCSAARIEGAVSRTRFLWGRHLAQESENLFRAWEHPLTNRAALQRIRCMIKDPETSLEEAERELEKIDPTSAGDAGEETFIKAEKTLAYIWIRGRQGKWEECEELSRTLSKCPQSLRRLRIEALYHQGNALIKLGKVGSERQQKTLLEKGRRVLHDAIKKAQEDDRHKTVAAAFLALCESHLPKEKGEARRNFESARQLGEGIIGESSYLSNRFDELGKQLEGPSIVIDVNKPYAAVLKDFKRAYIEYYEGLAQGKHDLFYKMTGMSPSTRSRHGRPRRGRPRKTRLTPD